MTLILRSCQHHRNKTIPMCQKITNIQYLGLKASSKNSTAPPAEKYTNCCCSVFAASLLPMLHTALEKCTCTKNNSNPLRYGVVFEMASLTPPTGPHAQEILFSSMEVTMFQFVKLHEVRSKRYTM